MGLVSRTYRRIRRNLWRISMLGLDRGHHVTRYAMYQALGRLNLGASGNVLSISHSANLCGTLGITPTSVTEANFPEVSIFSMPFMNASFDFVVSDQVLEHVEGNPQTAINECTRVLKPGGIACHTTCFMYPRHMQPGDFWRFTEDGLRVLHAEYEVITAGSWGNLAIWKSLRDDGLLWDQVPHATWHPLHRIAVTNDPEWAVMTWIVARKHHDP